MVGVKQNKGPWSYFGVGLLVGPRGDMVKFKNMKKHFFAILLVLLAGSSSFAQTEEMMIIKPGRETFVHFPSETIGSKHTLTVFLPEAFVPLKGRYPLIVLLGAGPQQAPQAAAYMEWNKAVVAAIDFEEADYAEREKIVRFVSRELLPYLQTNYPILPGPENCVIAAQGRQGAVAAFALLSRPGLFSGAALASPGDAWADIRIPSKPFRAFVTGTQDELARAQEALEQAGQAYGPGFALEYASAETSVFGALRTDYLFAPQEELTLSHLRADVSGRELQLESADTVSLRILARLKNGITVDYVPPALRISPLYLKWTPRAGTLRALAGADAGTVKIRPVVDKPSFSVKIRLKK